MKREESKLRKKDEQNSRIVTEWLEKNVYSKHTTDYIRREDKEHQVQGIDSTFKIDGVEYHCDEKAAVAYINNPLTTFAFELSFINRANVLQDGWFLSDDVKTDSYLFVWIDKAKSDVLETVDDIEVAEAVLIRKKEIISYLEGKGWTLNRLRLKDKQIRRENGLVNMGNIYRNGCRFSYSKQLVEKPVNILITRDKLREMNVI